MVSTVDYELGTLSTERTSQAERLYKEAGNWLWIEGSLAGVCLSNSFPWY